MSRTSGGTKKLAWFFLYWLLGVAALGAVSWLIRSLL
ncbi:MAG: DUF2474 family protein [Woeseia sp.]